MNNVRGVCVRKNKNVGHVISAMNTIDTANSQMIFFFFLISRVDSKRRKTNSLIVGFKNVPDTFRPWIDRTRVLAVLSFILENGDCH